MADKYKTVGRMLISSSRPLQYWTHHEENTENDDDSDPNDTANNHREDEQIVDTFREMFRSN